MAISAFPQGNEFLVNTRTEGGQGNPSITSLSNGRFVVSWYDGSGQDGDASYGGVKAQIFYADGSKAGSEFLVNTQTLSFQGSPTITGLPNGGFVVSWSDLSGDATGGDTRSDIKAQIFDSTGTAIGSEFLVNTETFYDQTTSSVTSLSTGGFVVTWQDYSGRADDPQGYSIRAQIFNANGGKIGSEFLVNTEFRDNQTNPTITSLSNGNFVVSWQDASGEGQDTSVDGIKAQIFNSDGGKVGGEFLVNTQTFNSQNYPSITSLSSGGFVVTWEDYGGMGGADADGLAVKGQVFKADGSKAGGEFLVNTQTYHNQRMPAVLGLDNGAFVVTWQDESGQGGDSSGYGIKAQVFNADGSKSGTEFLVSTATYQDQSDPTITSLSDGRFVVSWADASRDSGDISAQIFGVDYGSAPLAVADTGFVSRGTNALIDSSLLLANDNDPDGDSLYVQSVGNATNGTASLSDQTISFMSASNPAVTSAGFDYTATDGSRASSAHVSLSLVTTTDNADRVTVATTAGQFSYIDGMAGNDKMTGGAGTDILLGGSGNDTLNGGAGADMLQGGADDDTYYVDDAGDQVFETAGNGTDRVLASATYTLALGQEIETLTTTSFTGTTAINLTGNEIANTINGNAGSNTIDGRGGADTMTGGAGDDTYYVDNAADRVYEVNGAGSGNDIVYASVSYALAGGQVIETLAAASPSSTAALGLTGNEGNNTIIGNAGDNTINGGGGVDTMNGGAGNDLYYVDRGGDLVNEAVGGGNDTVRTSVSFTLGIGQEVETLTTTSFTGTTAINLTGNEFNNTINGNAGDNMITGGTGNDTMTGGAGNDSYYVDSAGDVVKEVVGGGNDAVRASASYTLGAGQEIETLTTTAFGGTTALNLTGNEFNNIINANAGSNTLDGKLGNDTLTGGNGSDTFLFDTTLGSNNVDTITDFSRSTSASPDMVALSRAIFSAFSAPGALPAGAFTNATQSSGFAGETSASRILYDTTTGGLFYDADGNTAGGSAPTQFATLTGKPAISGTDFKVV